METIVAEKINLSQLGFAGLLPKTLAERKKTFLHKTVLVEVCDVCGNPLKKNQKLGKKKSDDALCHSECLYYKKVRSNKKLE